MDPWQQEQVSNNPEQLKILTLRGEGLTELPPYVFSLPNLRDLRVNDNLLTSLPPEIGSLRKLRTLDLSNNCLTKLPDEFGQLDLSNISPRPKRIFSMPPNPSPHEPLSFSLFENSVRQKASEQS